MDEIRVNRMQADSGELSKLLDRFDAPDKEYLLRHVIDKLQEHGEKPGVVMLTNSGRKPSYNYFEKGMLPALLKAARKAGDPDLIEGWEIAQEYLRPPITHGTFVLWIFWSGQGEPTESYLARFAPEDYGKATKLQ